jgi:hypothetical protein
MTHAEAFRQIVDKVNSRRDRAYDYRNMGTVATWSKHDKRDDSVVLDSVVMTLKTGAIGAPQRVREDGKPPDSDDVRRIAEQIVSHFDQPAKAH